MASCTWPGGIISVCLWFGSAVAAFSTRAMSPLMIERAGSYPLKSGTKTTAFSRRRIEGCARGGRREGSAAGLSRVETPSFAAPPHGGCALIVLQRLNNKRVKGGRSRQRRGVSPKCEGPFKLSVELYGLRPTARELALSPTGLNNLLVGTNPYSKTASLMRTWYADWLLRESPLDEAGELTLEVLANSVAPEQRQQLTTDVRALLRRNDAPDDVNANKPSCTLGPPRDQGTCKEAERSGGSLPDARVA